MKRNSERLYWMTNENWYRINTQKGCFELTDEAPERAKRSFAMWNRPERLTVRKFIKQCKVRFM